MIPASFLALLLGSALCVVSASTVSFDARFGMRRGQVLTVLLRDVLGIPLWVAGLAGMIAAPSPNLIPSTTSMQCVAWCLIGLGVVAIAWALVRLRRRSLAPTVVDQLETGGPYALVRHPIYAGAILQLLAMVLVWPKVPVGLACALSVAWLVVQARLEERDLSRRRPEYADYAREVPRFFPRLSIDAFPRPGRR